MILNDIYDFEGIVIRKPREDDSEVIFFSYAQDKEVTKYLSWTAHKSIEDTKNFISNVISIWGNKIELHYIVCFKETDMAIGMLSVIIKKHIVTIGYVLAKEYWGRGIMSKVVKNLSELLLKQYDIYRVDAICDVGNIGSKRVLEKSGFQCEGILKRFILHPAVSELPRDVYIFSKIR